MDSLPLEIVDHLYTFLSTKCIKSLRLACKSFAEIGESHLFKGFEFRLYPQQSRLAQLRDLSLHPTIAPRLRCLCYESGIQLEHADYSYWKTQLYNDPKVLPPDDELQEDPHQSQNPLGAHLTPDLGERYEEYRLWLDYQAGTMAHSPEVPSTFASVLSKCHAMTSIKMVMSEPETTLDDLAKYALMNHRYIEVDNMRPGDRVSQRRRNCLAHFMSLLKAVHSAGRIISELIAFDVPKEILSNITHEADIMNAVFSPLQQLDLKIRDFPPSRSSFLGPARAAPNRAAMALPQLLNEPNDLQRLSLSFQAHHPEDFSTELLYSPILDRAPRRWLPGLKRFSLSNFLATWPDLIHLFEDATSLTSLTLCEATLVSCSMIDLLMILRGLKLDDVCIDGRWVVDEDGGEWHSHDENNFSGCGIYDGPYDFSGLRHDIESYIIKGGECPLPEKWEHGCAERIWHVKGDTSWHWLGSST